MDILSYRKETDDYGDISVEKIKTELEEYKFSEDNYKILLDSYINFDPYKISEFTIKSGLEYIAEYTYGKYSF